MAKCKLGCGNEAVEGKWRKRYCRACGERYLSKKREYDTLHHTLPVCSHNLDPNCTGRVSPHHLRNNPDTDACTHCDKVLNAQLEEEDANDLKLHYLDNAETVHELREWIKEHML
jgi:hypothetical protein